MKAIGIVLITLGILMFVFSGFNYTKKEKVVDLGPLEINKSEKEHVGWPVYAGGIAVLAGVVVLAVSRKKA